MTIYLFPFPLQPLTYKVEVQPAFSFPTNDHLCQAKPPTTIVWRSLIHRLHRLLVWSQSRITDQFQYGGGK
jgi:hypothetical protein